jgi:hypothetical protein
MNSYAAGLDMRFEHPRGRAGQETMGIARSGRADATPHIFSV